MFILHTVTYNEMTRNVNQWYFISELNREETLTNSDKKVLKLPNIVIFGLFFSVKT